MRLKNLMTMVRLVQEDTLRDMSMAQFRQYYQFVKDFTSTRVEVESSAVVHNFELREAFNMVKMPPIFSVTVKYDESNADPEGLKDGDGKLTYDEDPENFMRDPV